MVTGEAAVLLDQPPGAAESAMARFIDWLAAEGRAEVAGYEQLWTWSVDHPDEFWPALWDFFAVRSSGRPDTVLADAAMPGARWFPGVRLNYAEQVFAQASPDRPALVATVEGGDPVEVSWVELQRSVTGLAQSLRTWGVRPDDRMADAARLRGASDWEAGHLAELLTRFRAGASEFVTDDVKRLIGRDPRSVADFVNDHRSDFTAA
jgi:Acetyl-coenzyme A synthetase N-terminus